MRAGIGRLYEGPEDPEALPSTVDSLRGGSFLCPGPSLENYQAVVEELIRAKPSAAKGRYIRSIVMTSTMGPGVKVDPSRVRDILEEAAPAAA